jgi:acetyl esterase/lipase
VETRFQVYEKNIRYVQDPFRITDMRPEERYQEIVNFNSQTLNVYRPAVDGVLLERRPVVFYIHGGGWTDNYAAWHDFVARSFTGEKGWITVIIDYRLTSFDVFAADPDCLTREACDANAGTRSKAAWYPDNIEDVAIAFEWVLDNIVANGGDAGRIVVFGHSAGAHLATLLTTHPDYAATLRPGIQGLVSMSGAFQLAELNKVFWASAVNQTFQGGIFNNDTELNEASAASYVDGDSKLPPIYLLYAEDELPSLTNQNLDFHDQLLDNNQRVTMTQLAGYGHVSEMEAVAYITETPTILIVDFIESVVPAFTYLPVLLRDAD